MSSPTKTERISAAIVHLVPIFTVGALVPAIAHIFAKSAFLKTHTKQAFRLYLAYLVLNALIVGDIPRSLLTLVVFSIALVASILALRGQQVRYPAPRWYVPETSSRFIPAIWWGGFLGLALLVTTFLITRIEARGMAMSPGISNGEYLSVLKYETWLVRSGVRQWKRGQVVVFRPPEGAPNVYIRAPWLGFRIRAFFIKRIIGLPGDEVSLRDGVVYLNGKALDERHITDKIEPYTDSYPIACYKDGNLTTFIAQQQQRFDVNNLPQYVKPAVEMLVAPSQSDLEKAVAESDGSRCAVASLKLKPGYYYMMGDNRTFGGSEDSRTFGPVSGTSIAGRANAIWWPINRIRGLGVPEGFKQ